MIVGSMMPSPPSCLGVVISRHGILGLPTPWNSGARRRCMFPVNSNPSGFNGIVSRIYQILDSNFALIMYATPKIERNRADLPHGARSCLDTCTATSSAAGTVDSFMYLPRHLKLSFASQTVKCSLNSSIQLGSGPLS